MTMPPHLGLDRAGDRTDGDDGIVPDVGNAAGCPRWVNRPHDGGMPRRPAPDWEDPFGLRLPRWVAFPRTHPVWVGCRGRVAGSALLHVLAGPPALFSTLHFPKSIPR